MSHITYLARCLVVSTLLLILVGCGATHTMVSKRNLDVQTKMSDTIFLTPVNSASPKVLVQVRNTSDKPDFNMDNDVKLALMDRGYTITKNPDEADYMLQANVKQVANADLRDAEDALEQGFGGALAGGVVGAVLGSGGHSDRLKLGTLVGAIAGTVADAMVKDVFYSVVTDLQISERAAKGVAVRVNQKSKLSQGSSTVNQETSNELSEWKRYQTRIVSTANQVNLSFEDAAPELAQGLGRSISGIF